MEVRRGDIYLVRLEASGSIQGNLRPCVVVSNEKCNTFSPVITVIGITSQQNKREMPTHVTLYKECGLIKPSIALCEQILTINKTQIVGLAIGKVTEEKMLLIEKAMMVQVQFGAFAKVFHLINSINELSRYINSKNGRNTTEYIMDREIKICELRRVCDLFNLDYYGMVEDNIIEITSGVKGGEICAVC